MQELDKLLPSINHWNYIRCDVGDVKESQAKDGKILEVFGTVLWMSSDTEDKMQLGVTVNVSMSIDPELGMVEQTISTLGAEFVGLFKNGKPSGGLVAVKNLEQSLIQESIKALGDKPINYIDSETKSEIWWSYRKAFPTVGERLHS